MVSYLAKINKLTLRWPIGFFTASGWRHSRRMAGPSVPGIFLRRRPVVADEGNPPIGRRPRRI